MTTRRIFLQPNEALELMSNDGQSAVKITLHRDEGGHLVAFVQTQPFTETCLDLAPLEQRNRRNRLYFQEPTPEPTP